jgi:hypothetical protein
MSPFEIREAKNDFLVRVIRFSFVTIIPPMFHSRRRRRRRHHHHHHHHHPDVALTRRTKGEAYKPSKMQCSFGNREALDRKALFVSKGLNKH